MNNIIAGLLMLAGYILLWIESLHGNIVAIFGVIIITAIFAHEMKQTLINNAHDDRGEG